MNILIIVKSKHNDNTLKIAEAMSEAAPVTLARLEDIENYNIKNFDIIGFGSGVYMGNPDKDMLKFIDKIDYIGNAFVFSTSMSLDYIKANERMTQILTDKGWNVLGSFGCKGFSKMLFFRKNKLKPDIDDFENAQNFIYDIVEKLQNSQL